MGDEFVILLDQPDPSTVENSVSQEDFVILLDPSDGSETDSASFTDDLTIEYAGAFQNFLLSELASGEAVSINLEKLKCADTAGLQLLYAAALKATADGVAFTLRKPSQVFRDTVAILGFCSLLEGYYSQ